MSKTYRADLIPRWVWVILPISLALVAVVGLSMPPKASESANWGNVQTANPKDYVESAAPKVTITPSPAPAQTSPQTPSQSQTPSENAPSTAATQSPGPSTAMPRNFTFGGTKFVQNPGNPVELEVMTTGEYAGSNIIYKKPDAQPPYKELYIETSPNSGKFYRYTPQKTIGNIQTSEKTK